LRRPIRADRFGSYSIRGEASRDADLVALEVDPAVVLLLAAAAMANRDSAGIVPPGTAGLRLGAAACTAGRS